MYQTLHVYSVVFVIVLGDSEEVQRVPTGDRGRFRPVQPMRPEGDSVDRGRKSVQLGHTGETGQSQVGRHL